MSGFRQRSRSTFLKCRAPCAAVRSPGAAGRSPKPGPPDWRRVRGGAPRRRCRLLPEFVHPAPQHRVAQTELLGHRRDRATARHHQLNGLLLVLFGKRPTLTFHSTPPGSMNLLQVSTRSGEVQCRAAEGCEAGEGFFARRQTPHPVSRFARNHPLPQGERVFEPAAPRPDHEILVSRRLDQRGSAAIHLASPKFLSRFPMRRRASWKE